jgi:type I restriction enzyme S subunit
MSRKTKTGGTQEESTPSLVPTLRFPEFREAEGWHQKRLGSVGQLTRGLTYSADDLASTGLLVLRSTNIQNGSLVLDQDLVFVRKPCPDVLRIQRGDIVICMSNGSKALVGKSGEYSGEYQGEITVGAFCSFFRPARPFAKIAFHLNSYQTYIADLIAGGNINNLTNWVLEEFRFPIPDSPAEQQKIAECLSSVDELIAAQARKVDALKTHKKGLMQQLFPREGETQPRLRFPEFQNAGEWEETTLGELAKLVRGPFGGSLKKEIFVASGYAVYEQQHAIYSDFSFFRYHITAEKFRELMRFAVAANDVIMSCSGTMGKFAIVPDGAAPGVINQALLKLTPHELCNTNFLKELLELPSVQQKLLAQSAGGAIQNVVAVDQIKALPLRLPSADEQKAVVGCLSSIDALISAETQKLDALKTHKKGLMQQLFPPPAAVEA